ncbi:hypothetical protein [uncultured Anaerovibrio sp.]|uniref:hypothetical protein n=1 Tax=uncultured Anaerovibrio sp. TaxID=361586 RepID=UPI00261DB66A|nr:hypothetical protein [uncultured Anaerovibrio sp.]
MRRIFSLFVVMVIVLTATAAFAYTDISSGSVVAEGLGAPGQTTTNGYRAAKVDALRNLLEQTENVLVDSQTIVRDAMVQSDVISIRVNGLVKGARITDKYKDDLGYHVVMEIPVYGGANSLAAAVLPQKPQVSFPEPETFVPRVIQSRNEPVIEEKPVPVSKENPAPTETPGTSVEMAPALPAPNQSGTMAPSGYSTIIVPPDKTKLELPKPPVNQNTPAPSADDSIYTTKPTSPGTYTGVIVDCQGLELQTNMAPAIWAANNQVVYGAENFPHEDIISRGYVSYTKSLTSGVERAGNNPIIIKAAKVERSCIPVISDADAAMILQENKATGFLNKGNVVFVK